MTRPPRTRLNREQSQEQTRQRLIAAACRLVAERGFAAASVRDIAEAAGYSQGAFYSNFAGKEELLLDILKRHKTAEAKRIRAIVDAAGGDFDVAMSGIEDWAGGFSMNADEAMLAVELQLQAARNRDFGAAYEALMAEQRTVYAGLVTGVFALGGREPPAPAIVIADGLIALARAVAIDGAIASRAGDQGAGEDGKGRANLLVMALRLLFGRQGGG